MNFKDFIENLGGNIESADEDTKELFDYAVEITIDMDNIDLYARNYLNVGIKSVEFRHIEKKVIIKVPE